MSGGIMNPAEAERLKAERLHAAEAGRSCDFDFATIDEGESPTAVLADELSEALSAKGMTPKLALAVAEWMRTQGMHVEMRDGISRLEQTIYLILNRICDANGPRREADCMRMAFGFRESNDDSMRSKAMQYGVTVEAISKDVAELRRVFAVGINSFNKSEAAAAAYAMTNKIRRKL
jgi:hypothetical protein